MLRHRHLFRLANLSPLASPKRANELTVVLTWVLMLKQGRQRKFGSELLYGLFYLAPQPYDVVVAIQPGMPDHRDGIVLGIEGKRGKGQAKRCSVPCRKRCW